MRKNTSEIVTSFTNCVLSHAALYQSTIDFSSLLIYNSVILSSSCRDGSGGRSVHYDTMSSDFIHHFIPFSLLKTMVI